MNTIYKKSKHNVYLLNAHVIFCTKYRRKVLYLDHIQYLRNLFDKLVIEYDSEILELNGEKDHIHFILSYPPHHSILSIVQRLKGVSSRRLRQKFKEIDFNLGYKKSLWSRSFFVSNVGGVTLDVVRKYIENQEVPNS